MFFVLYFMFFLAGLIVSLEVLFGYKQEYSFKTKAILASVVIFAWFCPAIVGFLNHYKVLPEAYFVLVSKVLYSVFIVAFLFFCLIFIRDGVWEFGYQIYKRVKKVPPDFYHMTPRAMKKANLITGVVLVFLSAYAFYQGVKFPEIKRTEIYTPKVTTPFKLVALTDLHLTPFTSDSFLKKLVKTVNDLKPEAIVLVGDIAGDKPENLAKQLSILENLNAFYGVFVTLGNREFYYGSVDWEREFKKRGFFYLGNTGLAFNGTNVHLSGLPDPQFLKLNPLFMKSIETTLKNAEEEEFRIFLSHSPKFIKRLHPNLIDLQISGHTRGGQIFPMHYYAKKYNDFLAGLYSVRGMKLYVSRGVGTWGAPMRLFAPSEISVIEILPETDKKL